MKAHSVDSLRAQLAEIDRLIKDCGDNPNLERLVSHLRGRRELTQKLIDRCEGDNDGTETDGSQRD